MRVGEAQHPGPANKNQAACARHTAAATVGGAEAFHDATSGDEFGDDPLFAEAPAGRSGDADVPMADEATPHPTAASRDEEPDAGLPSVTQLLASATDARTRGDETPMPVAGPRSSEGASGEEELLSEVLGREGARDFLAASRHLQGTGQADGLHDNAMVADTDSEDSLSVDQPAGADGGGTTVGGDSAAALEPGASVCGQPLGGATAVGQHARVGDTDAHVGHRPHRLPRVANTTSRQVMDAAHTVHNLVERMGPTSDSADVPPAVRRQKWSTLNVPIMWAAAGVEDTTPVLRWLHSVVALMTNDVDLAGTVCSGSTALHAGWLTLRRALRSWGVQSQQDLADWLRREGFPQLRVGDYFSRRAQEHVLHKAVAFDVQAAGLELMYVKATLHLSRQPRTTGAEAPLAEAAVPCGGGGHNSGAVLGAAPLGGGNNSSGGRCGTQTSALVESDAGGLGARMVQPGELGPRYWRQLDSLDLEAELRKPVRTVREPPRWFRGALLQAYGTALREWNKNATASAWKLVLLVPRMLLRPTDEKGVGGKEAFRTRHRRFMRGEWLELLAEASPANRRQEPTKQLDEETLRAKRAEMAEQKICLGEVSRGRMQLTSLGLAPGTQATLDELTDTSLRPAAPSPGKEVPDAVLQAQPSSALQLDPDLALTALRSAGRGSAQDLAGTRYEHLRVLVDDTVLWGTFVKLLQAFANADVPLEVSTALRLGRLTALKKDNGRVRGIVAGAVIRRLACRAMVMQFSDALMAETMPYQYALQTRAGTEALAHAVQYLLDMDEDAVVASLDGVGAFDHVHRAAFLGKLADTPALRPLLPLARMLYATQSRFLWTDDQGLTHEIRQGEGGEQGCPLMPALFALAQHSALATAAGNLLPTERLFAFLDDLYVVTTRDRAHAAFREVADLVEQHAGVKTHLGKLKVWGRRCMPAPEDLQAAAPEAWVSDKPPPERGLVVLGTPLGSEEYVQAHANERMRKEQLLLDRLTDLGDLQCRWVMLSQSAAARANHMIRILPPTHSRSYSDAHDDALWEAFCNAFGAQDYSGDRLGRAVATLPGRMGGLGLRSATRTAPAAYWASWANTLEVLHKRVPDLAEAMLQQLVRDGGPTAPCLREAATCLNTLLLQGALDLPTWAEARAGAKAPPPQHARDAADLDRGWQCHACSFSETHFMEHVVLPAADGPRRALLLSQSGGPASAWLRSLPTERAKTLLPLRLQVAVRRRLRWPLPMVTRKCGRTCSHEMDSLGDRAAACAHSGRLKLRSRPLEKMWARVLREGGARVRENVYLRDTVVPGLDPRDGRHIEIVATGLPIEGGVPLAVDATMVSPLRADGTTSGAASRAPGTALKAAEDDKRRTYPELVGSPLLRLCTVACEVGGRFNSQAVSLLEQLALARARTEVPVLRRAAARAWRNRWLTLLAVCAQDALAATLVDEGSSLLDAADSVPPLAVDVWLDDGYAGAALGTLGSFGNEESARGEARGGAAVEERGGNVLSGVR